MVGRGVRPGDTAGIDAPALLRAHGILPPDVAVEAAPLAGGYWNEVLRLTGDGVDWVVKVFADQDGWRLFPILPDDEARALALLRGARVAPDPVAYLPRTPERPAVLVYAWVAGGPWQTGTAAVAELMRRQHAVAADGFRSVPTASDGILAEGERLLAGADPVDAAALRALAPTRPVQAAARRALIHTDAGTGTVIVGPDGPRLIDWQCPALGDPAEDLFAFLSPAFQVLYGHEPLTAAERAECLEAYGDREVLARLAALEPALAWRFAAYCAMRRVDLAHADPDGSARYARALALSLDLLEALR
ncbi:MAG: phosphotransferase family protein [Actinomycetota bacterium]